MPNDKKPTPIEQGRIARLTGEPNPFPSDSAEHDEFEEGKSPTAELDDDGEFVDDD